MTNEPKKNNQQCNCRYICQIAKPLKVVDYPDDVKCFLALLWYDYVCASNVSVFVCVSSPDLRTKGSSLGLSDWAPAADQPSV